MSVDKLVDSTQLDADLTSVANAIRTKGGTSAQLAFPAGFVSAINDISGGGEDNIYLLLKNQLTEYTFAEDISSIPAWFSYKTGLEKIRFPSRAVSVAQNAFRGCTSLSDVNMLHGSGTLGQNVFTNAAFSAFVYDGFSNSYGYAFQGCPRLTILDANVAKFGREEFSSTPITTLILRRTSITAMSNVDVVKSTVFKNGGTGGTIYIPKALYDHLGDGTSLDYKAATNWSTIDGYGTITWTKIEGSIYETQYADGTPIS